MPHQGIPAGRLGSASAPATGWGEEPLLETTRVFLTFLQGLFEQSPDPDYKWSPDLEQTRITITDQGPVNLQTVERRPAILTVRGPVAWANLSLDQLREMDARTGKRTHTDLLSGTMAFYCIAREGLEAQRVAWIVFKYIRIFRRRLQKQGLFRIGDEGQIGQETPAGALVVGEADNEFKMVQVTYPFFVQDTWTATPTYVKLAEIRPQLIGQATEALRAPQIRGRAIRGELVPLEIKQLSRT